jgi:hypothetical protein
MYNLGYPQVVDKPVDNFQNYPQATLRGNTRRSLVARTVSDAAGKYTKSDNV